MLVLVVCVFAPLCPAGIFLFYFQCEYSTQEHVRPVMKPCEKRKSVTVRGRDAASRLVLNVKSM